MSDQRLQNLERLCGRPALLRPVDGRVMNSDLDWVKEGLTEPKGVRPAGDALYKRIPPLMILPFFHRSVHDAIRDWNRQFTALGRFYNRLVASNLGYIIVSGANLTLACRVLDWQVPVGANENSDYLLRLDIAQRFSQALGKLVKRL